ncbi:hypothetical protein B0H11DRAFT_1916341 [Mycena galericulata]|nr:hypothetical protein B0H11DRAFT_1916341 [Mycena galericulata]
MESRVGFGVDKPSYASGFHKWGRRSSIILTPERKFKSYVERWESENEDGWVFFQGVCMDVDFERGSREGEGMRRRTGGALKDVNPCNDTVRLGSEAKFEARRARTVTMQGCEEAARRRVLLDAAGLRPRGLNYNKQSRSEFSSDSGLPANDSSSIILVTNMNFGGGGPVYLGGEQGVRMSTGGAPEVVRAKGRELRGFDSPWCSKEFFYDVFSRLVVAKYSPRS